LRFNCVNKTPAAVTVYALVQALHAHPNAALSLGITEEHTCIKVAMK